MIEALLNPPYPARIRLKQDIPFIVEYNRPYHHEPTVLTLNAGEIGEYFNECYVFDSRDGWAPFFSRVVLARLPSFIEVINE
ncbi:MAG: hypothetical protein ABFD50_00400 [Smithella sp.]